MIIGDIKSGNDYCLYISNSAKKIQKITYLAIGMQQ